MCRLSTVIRAAIPECNNSVARTRAGRRYPLALHCELLLRRASDAFGRRPKLLGLMQCIGATLIIVALTASARGQGSVTLAWDSSPDSAIAGYRLYEGATNGVYTNVVDLGNATSVKASNLVYGVTYYFAVTAYSNNGQESDFSGEISYRVPWPTDRPPVLRLASQLIGAGYAAPFTFNLAAEVTANGHTISQVQFSNGGTLLGTSSSAPYSFSWTDVSEGTYSLSAQVIDDSGSRVASAALNVTVAPTPPRLEINVTPNNAVILSVTGQPGQTYDVVCSQDFQTWTRIGTLTLDASGSGQFTDPAGTSRPVWLYDLQRSIPIPPRLEINVTPNNAVILSVTGQPGQTYDVVCSQDFQTWTVIGTVTLDASGSAQFTDPAGNSRPVCLYDLQRSVATPPRLAIQAVPGGGPVILSVTGQPDQTYDVVCSQDLQTWTVIGTVTLDASGLGQFEDPAGTSLPICLYGLQRSVAIPPRLAINAVPGGGPVILSVTGQPGQTYDVLSSQDLETWTPIGTVTLDESGSGQFEDPVGTSLPSCLYRLRGE